MQLMRLLTVAAAGEQEGIGCTQTGFDRRHGMASEMLLMRPGVDGEQLPKAS